MGFLGRGLGALQAAYAYTKTKRDSAEISVKTASAGPSSSAYSALRMVNLCLDDAGFKASCGCSMSVDYRAEYHARLQLTAGVESGNSQKAAGEAVAHAAAFLNKLGQNPTSQMLFDKELGATQVTKRTANYTGLSALVGTLAGIAFTAGTGAPVTGSQVEEWASDVTLSVLNGLITHDGTNEAQAIDNLAALNEATAPLPPNVPRELILLSRNQTIARSEAGLGRNAEQHSSVSSSMLLMARVHQEKACQGNPSSARRKSVLLYHVGTIEARHPSTTVQSWITVQPPVNGATMAANFEQLANAGLEVGTPGWTQAVTAHKNLILSHTNHGGAYGVIAEP